MRLTWKLTAVCASTLSAVLVGALLTYGPYRQQTRRLVVKVDEVALGGTLRRIWNGERRVTDSDLPTMPPDADAYEWTEVQGLLPIAHRFGPVFESGENTIATFEKGYLAGFRFFEVDLTLTSDGEVVCYHGSKDEDLDALTYARYLATKEAMVGASCRIEDVAAAVRSHPDTYVILDVKNRFDDAYAAIIHKIGDPALGKRFIPQLYHFGQAQQLRAQGFFAGELFTAYRTSLPTKRIFELARRARIEVVTINLQRYEEWRGPFPDDLVVFIHPVGDPVEAAAARRRGIDGIYTYYISPSAVPELFGSS